MKTLWKLWKILNISVASDIVENSAKFRTGRQKSAIFLSLQKRKHRRRGTKWRCRNSICPEQRDRPVVLPRIACGNRHRNLRTGQADTGAVNENPQRILDVSLTFCVSHGTIQKKNRKKENRITMAKQHWKGSVLLAPVPPTLVSCGTMDWMKIFAFSGSMPTAR